MAIGDVYHEVFVTLSTNKPGLEGLVEAENFLIEKTLREDWDYLWLIEGDIEVPKDAFRSLASLDVDIACGYYAGHDDFNRLVCGFLGEEKKVYYLPRNAVKRQVLSGWVFAGAGCLLIRRRVFEAGIRFRYVTEVGQDILFMYDAQSHGFIAKVHGDVECGHLPEWPLPTYPKERWGTLDVGCGHCFKGDVNVDLYPKASPHRSADQRECADVALKISDIPNFVKADGRFLPFPDNAFELVYSSHLIEHIQDSEGLIREFVRVAASQLEIRCPHPSNSEAYDKTKPLHIRRLDPSWFEFQLRRLGLRSVDVRIETDAQGEPWEIVARGEK